MSEEQVVERDESNVDGDEVEENEPVEPISQAKTKGHVMEVGPGLLSVSLPCGYYDEDKVLHRDVIVQEMTGVEEDLLAGKGPVMPRLNKVLANCITRFGTIEDRKTISHIANNLLAQDRYVLLVAVRRISLGDFFDVTVTCPSQDCKAKVNCSLDLSEIEVTPMDEDFSLRREDKLASGKKIGWHVMTVEDEEWLAKMKKKNENRLTLGMLSRIDHIDGKELVRDGRDKGKNAIRLLKNLSFKERQEIRGLFKKFEGVIDSTVDFVCSECEEEWSNELNIASPDFFFPSGM